jgi:tetratricopeptide (TPR) repeat protein
MTRFRAHATRVAAAVIVTAAVLAYAGSLRAPFVFDDFAAIAENPTIRHLWPPGAALSPPANGSSVVARPLVNLSLAINYAGGGLEVRGYHAFNLAIHALAGLVLFGLIRRTLQRPGVGRRAHQAALPLAFVAALLWTVHPLQTEAVTCVIQRTESLGGLFYLLVLYAFVRAVDSPHPGRWATTMVLACLAGMATKEVLATAPLLVLLYDRTFVAGTFREAWRLRRRWYLGLAATWLLLLYLVVGSAAQRGGTAGFGLGVSPWDYALTQCYALVLYLKLSFWPYPLVLDYGNLLVRHPADVTLQILLVLTLVAGTVVALIRRPALGFLGAWFFVILAPSSSVLPLVTQTMAEHRMYLPLAAVLVAVVLALDRALGRYSRPVLGVLAVAALVGTLRRNADYRDEVVLWRTNVAACPTNARAHSNLGQALYDRGEFAEAVGHFATALRIAPEFAMAHYNLGLALDRLGRTAEALAQFAAAAEIRPSLANAQLEWGRLLAKANRWEEAAAHYRQGLQSAPTSALAHDRLGVALVELGRLDEAGEHYARALQIDPSDAEAEGHWGAALLRLNRIEAALAHLERARRLNPLMPDVQSNLGIVLARSGRLPEALACFAEAVRLQPDLPGAQINLGVALAQAGRLPEALSRLEKAVELEPNSPDAHANLGNVLADSGRVADAIGHYERTLQLLPDSAQAHANLGDALLRAGRLAEAKGHFREALRLAPNSDLAREMIERLRAFP